MSSPGNPIPSKLITSVIYAQIAEKGEIRSRVEQELGKIELESEPFHFDKTEYYRDEMGEGLVRIFYAHQGHVDKDFIVEAKLTCYKIEKEYLRAGKRLANIDPGLISLENLILGTFKNFFHRIYLGRGVYGEVTLFYQKQQFRDLPWTYPDFKDIRYKEFFTLVRDSLYHEMVKGEDHQ